MAQTAKQAIDIDLSELEGFGLALSDLPTTNAIRVAQTALEKSAVPLIRAIKARVPVRTGALRKSIAAKAVGYAGSKKVVLLVGPSKGRYLGGKRIARGGRSLRGSDQPSKYAHLVEFGHHIAAGADGSIGFSKAKGVNLRKGKGRSAKFVAARSFMRAGVAAGTAVMLDEMGAALAVGLDREHKNVLRKRRRLKRKS